MQTTDTGIGAAKSSPYYIGEEGDRAFKLLSDSVVITMDAARGMERHEPLFSVSTDGLWEYFLDSFLDPVERQYHNCHCCHSFIRRYGGLVQIAETGERKSAIWSPAAIDASVPEQYLRAVYRMRDLVESKDIERQFLWKEAAWGVSESGGFSHLHLHVGGGLEDFGRYGFGAHMTEDQAMAVLLEDHKHLAIALGEMRPGLIDQAVGMLEAGGLIRSETLLPMAKFLQATHARLRGAKGKRRDAILWWSVARAARGWCTPRGSAFGALLEDITAGKSMAAITYAHNDRLNPLRYQRPQAAPSAGNIKQAERIFEQLGLGPALRRRPMALEEAELFWRPSVAKSEQGEGLFGHLTPKGEEVLVRTGRLASNAIRMTFFKFQRDVLPKALKLHFYAVGHGSYSALTTAADPAAPPLFKWDKPEQRNTGSWYLYTRGSSAEQWSLSLGLIEVLGLAKLPPDWNGATHFKFMTMGRVMLILKGAADRLNESNHLFPELLKTELHEVRSTIEAYSKSQPIEPEDRQRASGYLLSDGDEIRLEVTTAQGTAQYIIDRLE